MIMSIFKKHTGIYCLVILLALSLNQPTLASKDNSKTPAKAGVSNDHVIFEKKVSANEKIVSLLAVADRAFSEGAYEKAKKLYKELIDMAPGNTIGYLGLGKINLLLGDNKGALISLAKAVELDPDSPDNQFELGSTYLALGLLDDAVKHLKIAADLSPQRPEIQYKLANARSLKDATAAMPGRRGPDPGAFLDSTGIDESISVAMIFRLVTSGRVEESIEQAKRAAIKNPDSPNLQYQLGMLYKAQGDLNTALDHFENALRADPNHILALNQLTSVYLSQNNCQAAEDLLDQWLKLDPDDPSAHFNKAWCLILAGNFASAQNLLMQAVQLDPRNIELLNHYGLVLKELGNDKKATHIFQRALALNPDARAPRLNLALIYLADGKPLNADQIIEPLRKSQIKRPVFMAVSALIRARLGQLDEALEESDAAFKLAPNMPISMVARAEVLALKGKGEESIHILEDAHKLFPKNVFVIQELAESYSQVGRHDKAEAFARQARKLNPDHTGMDELLAMSLARQGKIETALSMAAGINYDDPQENEMLHGFILEESGRKKEALAFYKSLVEKDSDDLVAAYRLSLLYFKDQKYKNAENILDDILEENPGMEEARILLANLYFDKGLYKEAISQLDHIARGSMVELEAAFLAAKCQFKLNRFRDAVIGFKTLSASRDLKPDELIMYATALKETNDFISAKLMLAKAKNQDPKDKAVKAQIRRLEQDLPPIARLEIDRPESDRQD